MLSAVRCALQCVERRRLHVLHKRPSLLVLCRAVLPACRARPWACTFCRGAWLGLSASKRKCLLHKYGTCPNARCMLHCRDTKKRHAAALSVGQSAHPAPQATSYTASNRRASIERSRAPKPKQALHRCPRDGNPNGKENDHARCIAHRLEYSSLVWWLILLNPKPPYHTPKPQDCIRRHEPVPLATGHKRFQTALCQPTPCAHMQSAATPQHQPLRLETQVTKTLCTSASTRHGNSKPEAVWRQAMRTSRDSPPPGNCLRGGSDLLSVGAGVGLHGGRGRVAHKS